MERPKKSRDLEWRPSFRQISLLIIFLTASTSAYCVIFPDGKEHCFKDPPKVGNGNKSDDMMKRTNIPQIDWDDFGCAYRKRDQTVYIDIPGVFDAEVKFKLDSGKIILPIKFRFFEDGFYMRAAHIQCTKEPEWGEDYVDENCVKKYKDFLVNTITKKVPAIMLSKSVYRQCEHWPEED
jgi:hypothetical protein